MRLVPFYISSVLLIVFLFDFPLSLVDSLVASCRCQKRWRISVLLLWLKITRYYWSSFSGSGVADKRLREIKKIQHEEPKSFKRKGNKIQYTFIAKLQDSLDEVKSHPESNAVEKAKASLAEGTSMLSER